MDLGNKFTLSKQNIRFHLQRFHFLPPEMGIVGEFTYCSIFQFPDNPFWIRHLRGYRQALSNSHEIFLLHLPQIVIHMKLIFVIILVVDSNEFTLAKHFLNEFTFIDDLT